MVSVYLYVPNLIGYLRLALAFLGYAYALTDYRVLLGAYSLSQLLDAADGFAARALGQSSTFGAVLDMTTDRASTTSLCIVLGHLYPQYITLFAALVMVDMITHWYHMYASVLSGSDSHKKVTNPILAFYYWKPVLFIECAFTELWYLSLYTLHFTSGPLVLGVPAVKLTLMFCTPFFVFKQVCNLVQGAVACEKLVAYDEAKKKSK